MYELFFLLKILFNMQYIFLFFFSFPSRHDLQNHVDEMQTSIDNLQDFLTNANLNVDPSMIHSVSLDWNVPSDFTYGFRMIYLDF